MSSNIQNSKKRLVHLDLLRLISIFLVIFNHTGDKGYMLFFENMNSSLSFMYMTFSVFCKIAVPVFFMISGALLLPKQESLRDLFCKRILRMVIVLVVISIPFYVWLHRDQGLSIASFGAYIYGNSATTSLWYLYSYISFLLMLPFLRSMVKNMKEKDFWYLAIGYIVFVGVLPSIEYLLWHNSNTLHTDLSPALFTAQNVFFAIMGYYLEHILNSKHYNKNNSLWAIIFSIIAIFCTCLMTCYQSKIDVICDGNQIERFFNSFICIPAMTMYFLIKCLGDKIKNEKTCRYISILGTGVFGVYLIEKFIRAILKVVYDVLFPIMGSFIASLIWSFSVLCIGMMIVIILKHIPVLRKIVNKFI